MSTFFSNFLPDDGSVHEPKHVARKDQYMESVVTDGCFPYICIP
jgi:hypothetical protein